MDKRIPDDPPPPYTTAVFPTPCPQSNQQPLTNYIYTHQAPPPYYNVHAFPSAPPLSILDNGPGPRLAPPQRNRQQVQVLEFIGDLGKSPRRMRCPYCQAEVQTRVSYMSGFRTHVAALLLCIITGFCCWLPYCVNECKDAYHECPNCNMHLGGSSC